MACHERLAIAMALAGVKHHTLPGARRPREQSRPSALLEDCQRDTMIPVSKVELNGWPVLLPALEAVLACHRCLPATSTSLWKKPEILLCRSFLWSWPCMWTSWKNVSSSAVHNPFPAPRPQETVVKAGSFFPRERVQPSAIDVPAHQVGGEIGKDTPQQCVADPTV